MKRLAILTAALAALIVIPAQAKALVDMFIANFTKFEAHVDADVKQAAPAMRVAAE